MSPKLLLPAIAGLLLCMTACDLEDLPSNSRYNRDFHFAYPLKSGGRVAVESFNGTVEISTWDQANVDISGTKYGPTPEAADNLKVDIDHTADSVAIHVPRPYERRNNQGARFVIKVPATAQLDRIRTSNGAIRIHGVHGAIDAQTSNGPIDLTDIEGDVLAHSSNGHIRADRVLGAFSATTSNSSITATLDRVDRAVRAETSNGPIDLTIPTNLRNDLHANTSNSSITLHFPDEPNARVVAHTSNSGISSDFDLRVRGEVTKRHIDAVLGGGGPTIELATSNGPIRLLKSK
jgi:hypothetical protein